MAPPRQKVRAKFLVALTVVVVIFGVVNLRRWQQEERAKRDLRRTREALEDFTATLGAEQRDLAHIATATPSLIQRDAAALLVQVQELLDEVDADKGRRTRKRPAPGVIEQIHANFDRLKKGNRARFPRARPFLRGYLAATDGTFRPYGICVPKGYTAKQPMPLVIRLHGHRGFAPGQHHDAPYYRGAIVVRPEGRRATDYMYIGEDDVLAVLEDVRALYNVDAIRTFLVGHSMGGTGAWNMAVHYPHLFAGIAPSAGNADHRAWEVLWGWNPEDPTNHARLRAFLHASFSPLSYAENLEHCRVVAIHGTGDGVVPVQHSRAMLSRLRDELGFANVEYLEMPQLGHGGMPQWLQDYALGKLFGGRAATGAPRRFRYTTASLRHDRAWWLRVDGLGSPVDFSTVEASIAGKRAEIVTDNVSALTVLLGEAPGPVRRVRVDGTEFDAPPAGRTARLSLEKRDGDWREAPDRGLRKRKGLSGPVSDVLRNPFLVVYGTSGNSELLKTICEKEAERFAREWELRYGQRPRVTADIELNDAQAKAYSLVLFGGPGVNQVSNRVASRLPMLRFRDGAFEMDGVLYDDPAAGILLCYPNPLSEGNMVVMVAGNSPAALYQAFDRFGLWFNWGVYDKYKWFDFGVFDPRTIGPETFLTAGFFDNGWRMPSQEGGTGAGGALFVRIEDAAAQVVPQGFPRFASVAEADSDALALSELLPGKIEQYRGAVGFDRSYAGRPIVLGEEIFEKGLGVKAPSAIEFDLDGQYASFSATVGLMNGFKGEPTTARKRAEKVTFELWGDSELLVASEPLSWKDDGRTHAKLRASVARVRRLRLVVRPEGRNTWHYGAAAWGAPTVKR